MSNLYTNLNNLSIGANGADTIILSTSASSITALSASSYSATAMGSATAAANITALPSAKSFYTIATTVAINIKGITAGVDGQQLELYFKAGGANTMTITPQSTAAAAAARIVIMTTAATIVTTASGYASFRYNATDSKWLCKYVSL